ncbi:MAG: DUF2806 domain-containing protein [Succinivibrio sp.]|nr:DUF2806 domain-containing protein [Succinivibrio sp.]
MGVEGVTELLKGLGALLSGKPFADLIGAIWLLVHPQSLRNFTLLKSQLQQEVMRVKSGELSYDSKTRELIPGPQATSGSVTAADGSESASIAVENNLKDIAGRMVLGNSLNFIAALVAATQVALREGITPEEVKNACGTVEREFLNVWAERSMLIENESRREMWGQLLVEQVKAHNTLSVRTLRVFTGLTAEEKSLFERLTPYVFAQRLLPIPTNAGDPDFNYGHIKVLVDAGLLLSKQTSTYKLWPSDKEIGFKYSEGGCLGFCLYNCPNYILRFTLSPGEKLWRDDFLEGFELTKAGLELLKLSPKPLSKQKLKVLAQGLCPAGRELKVDVIKGSREDSTAELLKAAVVRDLSVVVENDSEPLFDWWPDDDI